MEKHDTAIHTARITARQAIIVAVITALGSIITTLIATGNLLSNRSRAEILTRPASVPAVLDAPHVYFDTRSSDGSLESCMQKAVKAVENVGLTGRDKRDIFAWGYRQQTTGLIWCRPDARLAIFLAAGKDYNEAVQTAEALARSF
jgi:hypothetical protein